MPAITFRPSVPADEAFLFEMHEATMRDYVAAQWGWDKAYQRDYMARHFKPGIWQIMQVDGEDAGLWVVEEQDNALFLTIIEILPAYQNQGIGSRLISDLIAQAHGRDLPVTLRVLRTNPTAKALYERLGFVLTAEAEFHFEMACPPPAK